MRQRHEEIVAKARFLAFWLSGRSAIILLLLLVIRRDGADSGRRERGNLDLAR
jgi:hypothetical protein